MRQTEPMLDDEELGALRQTLHLGQKLTGTVVFAFPKPGTVGLGVDVGLAVPAFVDVLLLPDDPDKWPPLGTVAEFYYLHMVIHDGPPGARPAQIRLQIVDPKFQGTGAVWPPKAQDPGINPAT